MALKTFFSGSGEKDAGKWDEFSAGFAASPGSRINVSCSPNSGKISERTSSAWA